MDPSRSITQAFITVDGSVETLATRSSARRRNRASKNIGGQTRPVEGAAWLSRGRLTWLHLTAVGAAAHCAGFAASPSKLRHA